MTINQQYLQSMSLEQKAQIGEKFLEYISSENKEREKGITVIDPVELANGIGLSYEQAAMLGSVAPQNIVYHLVSIDPQTNAPTEKWALSLEKIQQFLPWLNEDDHVPRAVFADYHSEAQEIFKKDEYSLVANEEYLHQEYFFEAMRPLPDSLRHDYAQIESFIRGVTPHLPSGIETSYVICPRTAAILKDPETVSGTSFSSIEQATNTFMDAPSDTAFVVKILDNSRKIGSQNFTVALKKGDSVQFTSQIGSNAQKCNTNRITSSLIQQFAKGQEINVDRWRVRVVLNGDKCGQDDKTTYTGHQPRVEFFDTFASKDLYPNGQFVASMDLATVLCKDASAAKRNPTDVLRLHPDIPAWSVLKDQISLMLPWLKQKDMEFERSRKPSLSSILNSAKDKQTVSSESISQEQGKQQKEFTL